MSDTPKEIWAWQYGVSDGEPEGIGEWYIEAHGLDGDETKYIREDVALAMVAAEREKALREAAEICSYRAFKVSNKSNDMELAYLRAREEILALIEQDASDQAT